MKKLSSQKVAQVLYDTQHALLSVTSERDKLLQKVANMERRSEAEKLAAAMHDKGLELDQDYESLADHLEKQAAQGKLPEIQRAVQMIAPNMKIAHLTNDERTVEGGSTDLERFLYGDIG